MIWTQETALSPVPYWKKWGLTEPKAKINFKQHFFLNGRDLLSTGQWSVTWLFIFYWQKKRILLDLAWPLTSGHCRQKASSSACILGTKKKNSPFCLNLLSLRICSARNIIAIQNYYNKLRHCRTRKLIWSTSVSHSRSTYDFLLVNELFELWLKQLEKKSNSPLFFWPFSNKQTDTVSSAPLLKATWHLANCPKKKRSQDTHRALTVHVFFYIAE